jgi:sugar phosphate permease
VVAVLWVIAFFYYFDRLMLTSMRDAIEADVGMTDAQFGLLTSWFLWVYGLLGPFGGFIADRFGKRRIILASLLMWSVAIWITGHTHSFHCCGAGC